VIFDVDPVFANSEEWYEAIPLEIRPAKDQPFYHLLAENGEGSYVAYVSQQNLVADEEDEPVDHPAIANLFEAFEPAATSCGPSTGTRARLPLRPRAPLP
jgi:heat shock protein HspQ